VAPHSQRDPGGLRGEMPLHAIIEQADSPRIGVSVVREYEYLIVGGGMTADAACRGIREHDAQGTIGLVGAEPHPPYARPPLSKALWGGKDEDTVWRGTADLGVDLVLGTRIESLDLDAREAADGAGERYRFQKLLLATGGTPRTLPSGGDGVVYFRSLDDFRRLHGIAGDGVSCVVVGGGFIGSEIAAALSSNGCDVSIVFPEEGIGARLFPAELSAFVNGYYRDKGVEVLAGETVDAVETRAGEFTVVTGEGRELEAAAVVAGLGIVPDTALAEAAGLDVRDGVVVDELGRAGGRDDVFAAGDVARFPVPALGIDMRVEHEDHANSHGAAVGANMAGAEVPYDHLPFFYSDLFDLGYEAVGEVDARLDTVVEWAEPNRKGVVCYVDDARRPRGFLLWDVWGKVDDARALIRAGDAVDPEAVRALIG
jgi:3-phenylpropionate/trans-cinnamate dioxygenase ferredoxin reductase component